MEERIIIDGELTNYIITEEGKIFNIKDNRREMTINKYGTVQLYVNGKHKGKTVCRLMAEAFIPNPDPEIYKYATNIDGDKTNNKLENIKWITASENSNKVWELRRKNGTTTAGRQRKSRKSEDIVEKIEKFIIEEDEKRIIIDNKETPFVITKEGRIRNLRTGNILKGSILATYPTVNLRWDGKQKNKSIHRLVAETWISNPNNLPVVDHIDGNRLNFNASNLRWVSHKDNRANIHEDIKYINDKMEEPIFTEEEINNEIWLLNERTGNLVSNLGRVKGKRGDVLSGSLLDCGYRAYGINKTNKVLGHILVWETFNQTEKPKDMVINHINGNKLDNRLSNLELVSQKENMYKAATETNAWNFKKVVELDSENNILRTFANASEAARAIGILPTSMRNAIRRKGKCYNGLRYEYIENE